MEDHDATADEPVFVLMQVQHRLCTEWEPHYRPVTCEPCGCPAWHNKRVDFLLDQHNDVKFVCNHCLVKMPPALKALGRWIDITHLTRSDHNFN